MILWTPKAQNISITPFNFNCKAPSRPPPPPPPHAGIYAPSKWIYDNQDRLHYLYPGDYPIVKKGEWMSLKLLALDLMAIFACVSLFEACRVAPANRQNLIAKHQAHGIPVKKVAHLFITLAVAVLFSSSLLFLPLGFLSDPDFIQQQYKPIHRICF